MKETELTKCRLLNYLHETFDDMPYANIIKLETLIIEVII